MARASASKAVESASVEPGRTDVDLEDFLALADRLDVKVGGRASATVLRLIETAAQLLEQHGEQGFRVAELHRLSGISTSSLYHHFGNRDGLIRAARAYQYVQVVPRDGEAIAELAIFARSADEFIDLLTSVIRIVQSKDRARGRLKQLEFLGSAVGRPELLGALQAYQTQSLTASEQVAEVLIQRGWVKDGISPRALVTFAEVLGFGRVVADLDRTPVDLEEWVRVVRLAVSGLFNVTGDGDAQPRDLDAGSETS
jgi:AcrR family transcriptional regulator